MVKQLKNYIGGQWVTSTASEYLPVTNPATCEVIGEVPDSPRADVDKAAKAAKEAFPGMAQHARAQPRPVHVSLQGAARRSL
jgi:malonate-semialdehyde dehydrogenase (acetylating)/methylmalonate-semialdehyde dehydrogenase